MIHGIVTRTVAIAILALVTASVILTYETVSDGRYVLVPLATVYIVWALLLTPILWLLMRKHAR